MKGTEATPTDYARVTFYEIFVQSFADSNGDGIGDIPGMTSKLDYLADLGISAIWLMPINPSPSYHKYDVTDYRSIHPDYGTIEDFKTFIREAHARNIRVIMDLVINHSASSHPWFLNARTGPDARYRDYYVWAEREDIIEELSKKTTDFDSDNLRQWHPITEENLTSPHYYGYFYGGMPDLNYDNPEVREAFYAIGRFWLEEVGVDGFRLDAAKHIFTDDRAADSQAFWKEFRSEMQHANPNVYLIGEVWSDAKSAAPYAQGFTALFNFDRAFSILESLKKGRTTVANIDGHGYKVDQNVSIASVINETLPLFQSYNPDFLEASFLSNHDQNRVGSMLDGNIAQMKQAAALLFTLPGTPYLYYGEEIGMQGEKPDEHIREPMLWGGSDPLQTRWIQPKHADSIQPVSVQTDDPKSIFQTYKQLIRLRKLPALAIGTIQDLPTATDRLIAFTRTHQGKTIHVIHNISSASVTIPLNQLPAIKESLWSLGKVNSSPTQVVLGANASLVYE